MSINVEPVVAHDEKAKFFMFLPEMAYGRPRNVMGFFLENFFKSAKKSKIRYGPTSGQKHAKFSD